MLSVSMGERCEYVRGPLAATNDTVVINIDCSQSTPLSHYVPLQLRDDVTHVAVQLLHCDTVPVGLFTNVTDNLTSVTVASEDAVKLFDGTFEGLERVTEFRLLGFTMLSNLSRSVLEPLRNIQTLVLDGFGSANIPLTYLGSVIQKLSGTPIRRLVLHKIKDQLFFQQTMKMDNFSIENAHVKELIITDAPLNYEGSIRRAFPDLVCFCGGVRIDEQTDKTLPAVWDLMLLSDKLEDIILYRPKDFSSIQSRNGPTIPLNIIKIIPSIFQTGRLYPDMTRYFINGLKEARDEDCELGFKLKFGANLSKVTVNRLFLWIAAEKPICILEDNNLMYLDFTGCSFPNTVPVLIGFKRFNI